MRRQDREVKDWDQIVRIMDGCDTCRLGLIDGKRVYIVPLSFGYVIQDGKVSLYFHGAQQGRKLDLMSDGGEAAFEMDRSFGIRAIGNGHYTMPYQSVCGYGKVAFVENRKEKENALRVLLSHYSAERMMDFSDAVYEQTCVFRLDVTEITCKENK